MASTNEPVPETSHLERVVYLFGYPIAHSLSPLLHQTIYDNLGLNWSQLPLPSTSIPHFLFLLRDPRCLGASTTMPHKVAIIQHLDALTDEGRQIGAVNTVFVREEDGKRKYVGTNTDVIGVREAFKQNVEEDVWKGRPGMVIGGGGAARSAVYALRKFLGCQTIYMVNRLKSEVDAVIQACHEQGYGAGLVHVETPQQARDSDPPGAIVSCVPDHPPQTPSEHETRKVLEIMLAKPQKGAILEMCYHPSPSTQIGNLAQKAGWQLILGTEALIWQGLEQDRYWTGKDVSEMPVEEVKAAIAKALNPAP